MTYKVLSFAPAPSAEARQALDRAAPVIRVDQADRSLKGRDLIRLARGYDGLVVGSAPSFPAEVLDALSPDLKFISAFTAGIDNIDVQAARRLGISIANTGSVVAGPTAEIAMLLILATSRAAGPGYDLVKQGAWKGVAATPPAGFALEGRTLGIVGMGNIGMAVAKRAAPFGLKVVYHNRRPNADAESVGAAYCKTLSALLKTSDIVSLHCPLTDETRGLIDRGALDSIRPGALLVNTARGELLDDEAVVRALDSGRLGGLGLDVYAGEPGLHPAYRESPKVFTLPHIGTATPQVRGAMTDNAYLKLPAFFGPGTLWDLVVDGTQ